MIEIIAYIAAAIVATLSWNIIHEMSHIIAAKILGNVKEWSIKPYPHMHDGNFRFAGSYWIWKTRPLGKKTAFIHLAPRIPNILSLGLLAFVPFVIGIPAIFLLNFIGSGIVDLFVGSIGYNDKSDLMKASEILKINPWVLRIIGFTLGIFAIVCLLISKFI